MVFMWGLIFIVQAGCTAYEVHLVQDGNHDAVPFVWFCALMALLSLVMAAVHARRS